MKIYTTPKAPYQVKLQIMKPNYETEHLSLIDTTVAEVYETIKLLIEKQNISPFTAGRVTNINIREWLPYPESKNGEQTSLSFKGLLPKEVLTLITNHYASNGLIQNNDGIYWAFASKNEGLMDKNTVSGKLCETVVSENKEVKYALEIDYITVDGQKKKITSEQNEKLQEKIQTYGCNDMNVISYIRQILNEK